MMFATHSALQQLQLAVFREFVRFTLNYMLTLNIYYIELYATVTGQVTDFISNNPVC